MSPLAMYTSPQALRPPPPVRPGPLAGAHVGVLSALGAQPPLPLPVSPLVRDFEDRRDYLRGLLSAMDAYLRAVLEEVAQNVPCDLDLRPIEALSCDLTSEVAGTMKLAAAALPGRRS
jgi:hypothetical protein